MASGNGRSDSHVGDGRPPEEGGERQRGEVQPGDDGRDANMASPSLHMDPPVRFCLQVLSGNPACKLKDCSGLSKQ